MLHILPNGIKHWMLRRQTDSIHVKSCYDVFIRIQSFASFFLIQIKKSCQFWLYSELRYKTMKQAKMKEVKKTKLEGCFEAN